MSFLDELQLKSLDPFQVLAFRGRTLAAHGKHPSTVESTCLFTTSI
ncbi:hypothetical protein [Bacillus massiliglaciei]|nr:hypothetical protein [Bacillus massiliglaciei]